MKDIVISKFGGSSVANPERIRKVAHYLAEKSENWSQVVVISAMQGETDHLINLAQEVSDGDPSRDELDKLLVTGEIKSAALLVIALRNLGLDAVSMTGQEIALEADALGRVQQVRNIAKVQEHLAAERIVVVTGFQGIEKSSGRIITLGRGGSDLSAIALAAALKQAECFIFTDTDGVYAVDPRILPEAKRFNRITYSQMIELSGAGAGVMMDRSVMVAQNLRVTIRVLLSPSFGESTGGTIIDSGTSLEQMELLGASPGIAVQRGVLLEIFNVPNRPGTASKIFQAVKDINIIDTASVPRDDEGDFTLFCSPDNAPKIIARLEELQDVGFKISEPLNVAGLTVIYPLMKETPGYLHRIFSTLSNGGINIEMFTSSGWAILSVVKEEVLVQAARALAQEFDLIENS